MHGEDLQAPFCAGNGSWYTVWSRCSTLFVDQPTFSGDAGIRAGICNDKSALRPDSSVVERGPEKAGVGGSIPSLATTLPFHPVPRGSMSLLSST